MLLPKCGLTKLSSRSKLDMEETETNNTKVSDSAYSTSCNSKSQRSSNSSNSQHSNSSASSGYCGHPPQANISNENQAQSHSIKYKDTKQKKTKNLLKDSTITAVEVAESVLPLTAGAAVTASTSVVSDARKQDGDGNVHISAINSTSENDALQATHSIKKKMNVLDDIHDSNDNENEKTVAVVNHIEEQQTECFTAQQSWPPNEGKFCIAVSLVNGFVIYTSASLKEVLGFPNDMWLGRSFIDFVHPKDRSSLSNFITSSMSGQDRLKDTESCKFFCRLRRYHSLRSVGFGVTEKSVSYLPFELNFNFREAVENYPCNINKDNKSCGIILLITASLVTSAFKHPDETCASPVFTIHHLASGKISFVDSEAVQHLGYLPQDMIDCSVFDFYHPEDLPFVKETYENLIEKCEPSFRSKPYRFCAQNGSYVLLETEWSRFVNPWSRKLELIISRSRALKGPSNPDVFSPVCDEDSVNISDKVLKESKVIQEEIQQLLHNVYPAATEISKLELSKRCKDLTTFVETLINENSKSNLKIDVPQEEHSFSEHDSVMLGEISPHHDYCDSKSSTETPPSYNQLNYHENIHRFFESKPKTTASDESMEMKADTNHSQMSTDEEGKCIPVSESSLDSGNQKCCSPVIGSRQSSESTAMPSCDMPHLTAALLTRHNEDMEKQMVQKHRELRLKGCDKEGKSKECRQKNLNDKSQDIHGVKRSGSHSWEGEPYKSSKYNHDGKTCQPCNNNMSNMPAGNYPAWNRQGVATDNEIQTTPLNDSTNYNFWLPFSITATQNTEIHMSSQQHNFPFPNLQNSSGAQVRSMIPVYYIPTGSQFEMTSSGIATFQSPQSMNTSGMIPAHYVHAQGPYMNATPSMMYHQLQSAYGAPPHMMCQPPIAMLLPATLFPTGSVQPQAVSPSENKHTEETTPSVNGHVFHQPDSLATSVKAEPGSAMGSVASASVMRGMSESSRNEPVDSQDERSLESFDDFDKSKTRLSNVAPDECTCDETSNSFYSSLKTETSDESMKNPDNNTTSENAWEKTVPDTPPAIKPRPVLKGPPWLNDVSVTSDLIFKYKMNSRQIMDVLEADKQTLMKIHQPVLVNEQLSQLYADMDVNLGNMAFKTDLEESLTSSSSSGEDLQFSNHPFTQPATKVSKKKKIREYSKLVMIFEENAPLPPPIVVSSCS